MTRAYQNRALWPHVGKLEDLGTALVQLASSVPDRTSLRQMLFFLVVARADLEGTPATFRDFEALVAPLGTTSLRTTYKLFLAGPTASGQGLGWLSTERSLSGTGRVAFKVTPKGRAALGGVLDACQTGWRE